MVCRCNCCSLDTQNRIPYLTNLQNQAKTVHLKHAINTDYHFDKLSPYPPNLINLMKNLMTFFFQIIGLHGAIPKHSQAAIRLGIIPGSSSQAVHPVEENWEDGECCVCLSSMKSGGEMRRLPCSHCFHRVCVDRWLNLFQKTCPLCRSYIEGGPVPNRKREELTEEMVIWFSSFHVAGF